MDAEALEALKRAKAAVIEAWRKTDEGREQAKQMAKKLQQKGGGSSSFIGELFSALG